MSDHQEPNGLRFTDCNHGEMILVYDGPWAGWLCYRGAEGQWVSLRKATKADHQAIDKAMIYAHHTDPDDAAQCWGRGS